MRKAEIKMFGVPAGELIETEEGYEFHYFPSYLQRPDSRAISGLLPLRAEPYRDKRLFPFFDGLIPEGWLLMLARSRALDRLRKRPTTSILAIPEAGLITEPNERLVQEEAAAAVHAGLADLPREQREAIALAFFEGCTHESIAELLGLPLGTVKTRIRLGILRLRERFRARDKGSTNS